MIYLFLFLMFILVSFLISWGVKFIFKKKMEKNWKILAVTLSLIGAVLFSLIVYFASLYTDSLWFKGLGYDKVFWKKVLSQWTLFAVFALFAFVYLKLNCFLLKKFLAEQLIDRNVQRIFNWGCNAVSGGLAVIVGFISSNQWEKFLMYLNQVPTGTIDPIFQKDISFYFFNLPVQDYLAGLLLILSLIACFSLGISYFLFIDREKGKFPFTGSLILISLLGSLIWRFILAQYHLLYSEGDVFYGANYTDIEITILAYKVMIMVLIAGIVALIANIIWRRFRTIVLVFGVFLLAWIFTGVVPVIYQQIVVDPNELVKEQKYIGYNIQYTRQAYGLDKIEEREFELDVSFDSLIQNQEALNNVRLWDPRALISSYRQRQVFRPYYDFSYIGMGVDRYVINDKYRLVMLAPRELEQEKLDSRTWINRTLKFTHGYGVVLNAASEFGVGGMPNLLLKDIPPKSSAPEIQVTRPEIYYGLLTRDYVIVKTTELEFDYPQGDKNIYTRYEGKGGIVLGSGLRRLALILKFNDKDILLSQHLKPESRIMFHRQIEERINTLAPFLKYDGDPYLVIDNEGKLWWIVDAYTVSSRYPYSEPYSSGGINYARNSVKVVINAYDGAVNFYVFDKEDPIIRTWINIFPDLFQPKEEMSQDMISHIRYPEALLYLQAKMYRNYHMTDPEVFYNREDVWQFGRELYAPGDELFYELDYFRDNLVKRIRSFPPLPQEVQPYYVIARLPDNSENEFIQMLPFTPRDEDNLIGWIAGRSDGDNYGNILVFKFSKQMLVYGPMQFEARIDQNPEMSEKFSLWSQAGSKVIRGNALIIPIENSLLYVEPIYIKATQSEMPEIKKIIVAMGDKLEWGDTFDEAILKLVGLEVSDQSLEEIVISAKRHFSEYQRLTVEGKLSEAGLELEKLKETLQRIEELVNQTSETND